MTIRIPQRTLADTVLAVFRKRRGVLLPKDVHQEFGPYVFAQAKRESFWKALFRPRGAPLPEGVLDWEEFIREVNNTK